MTDEYEYLMQHLRAHDPWCQDKCEAAADRIEAQAAEIERLRGELANAVEFAKGVIRHAGNSGDDYLAEQARTTLVELKGDKT